MRNSACNFPGTSTVRREEGGRARALFLKMNGDARVNFARLPLNPCVRNIDTEALRYTHRGGTTRRVAFGTIHKDNNGPISLLFRAPVCLRSFFNARAEYLRSGRRTAHPRSRDALYIQSRSDAHLAALFPV